MSEEKIILDPNLGLSENEKKKHDDALFLNAKIGRHETRGAAQAHANEVLKNIGLFIQHDSPEKNILKDLDYQGSAAVHVYYSHIMKQAFFVSQVDTMVNGTHEVVASDATMDLRKALMAAYNRKPTKKRSGF